MDAPNSKSECQRIISQLSKAMPQTQIEPDGQESVQENEEIAQDTLTSPPDGPGEHTPLDDEDSTKGDTPTAAVDKSSVLLCIPRLSGAY